MANLRTALSITIFLLASALLSAQVKSQVIQGPELEDFLRKAEIVDAEGISTGITAPQKLTMVLDGVTHYGVYKNIEEHKPLVRFEDGRVDSNFQDSWKSEIAAYEIDKIIGLGMVPATVERTYQGKRGSVQFFVDSMMSEEDRMKRKAASPSPEDWNRQIYKVRVFDNLVYNTDRTLKNLLITHAWEVVLIDHSRAFRPFSFLRTPKDLERFSRSLMEGLKRLTMENLTEKAGMYLPKNQIEGLLKRRDKILETAEKAGKKNPGLYYP